MTLANKLLALLKSWGKWLKVEVLNDYGGYVPLLFIIISVILLSRVRSNSFLFKKPSELDYPEWLNSIVYKKNFRTGLINLGFGVLFIALNKWFEVLGIELLGYLACGIGFAFISYRFIKQRLMPTTSSLFKRKNGHLSMLNIILTSWIIYYFFIDYFQLIWKSYRDDPEVEGPIRYVFYYTGMAIWKFLAPLIIMSLGRNKIHVINVILLTSTSLWFAYDFFDYLLKGQKTNEVHAFVFLFGFSIALFVLQNSQTLFKELKEG